MFRTITAVAILAFSLGACVDSIPTAELNDGDENRGDIWLHAGNKVQGGTGNQHTLFVSAPSDKDQLIICEADNPEKCNQNAKQYKRITKLENINHARSLFKLDNFTVSANMILAMKVWKTNDSVAFGRVTELRTDASTATPGQAAATGQTATYTQVAQVLNRSCVGCHSTTGQARNWPMASYAAMFPSGQKRAYVDNIVKSVKGAFQTIRGGQSRTVQQMPLRATPLSPADVALLEAWERGGFKQ